MTLQSTSLEESKLQIVLRPGQTEELATTDKKEAVLCNYKSIEQITDVATTICARDFKGFGTSGQKQNGVMEWK